MARSDAATYRVWFNDSPRGAVVLNRMTGFADDFLLSDGASLAATFPGDVRLHMDKAFPDNLLLVDSLPNPHHLLVVSERLAEFIRSRSPIEVEYLPVTIVDHRGRPVKAVYRIVHPTSPVDCLDVAASVPQWSDIDPATIDFVDRLVLDPARIEPDRHLFRIAGFSDAFFVRTDLAAAIEEAGFTGVGFIDPEEFGQ